METLTFVYGNCGSVGCALVLQSMYRIAGNFRGWKRSRISRYRRLPQVLSVNLCRAHAHDTGQSAICESFIRDMLNFNQFAKVFTHKSFPLYGRFWVCSWTYILIVSVSFSFFSILVEHQLRIHNVYCWTNTSCYELYIISQTWRIIIMYC